jgi:hypothetical protein
MDENRILRDHLLELLRGGSAHLDFDKAIKDLPADLRGVRPEGSPHSVWELVEHLRFTQWDILDFSRNPDYTTPDWPQDYWPKTPAPPDDTAWAETVAAFRRDLKTMQDLIADPKTDLYAKIPWGDGQTILREAMLVADHNGYHLGQIVIVRQMLGAWG